MHSSLRTAAAAALLLTTMLAAPPARPSAAPRRDQTPAAPLPREDAWRADLEFFAREFPGAHLDFARLYPRATFDAALDAMRQRLPAATDADMVLALMRLVASARVAHTTVRLPSPPSPTTFHRLPLAFQWFDDGLAVTAASEPYRHLLGLKVRAIGRLAPDALETTLAPYISHEQHIWLRQQGQTMMTIVELLRAAGQVDDDGRVAVTVAPPDGAAFTAHVTPVPMQNGPALLGAADELGIPRPLFTQEPERYYWYRFLPARKALYIHYRRCRDDPQQPFADFAREIFAALDRDPGAVTRIVIDLRLNTGGDSRVIAPLVEGLRARRSRGGGRVLLYGLMGPATFSSGLMAAMDLRNRLNAVLVGEPSGEKPNSYGEVRTLTLPHSKVVVQYSTKFFRLMPGDPLVFSPDVPVRRSLADMRAGRDPVLEAALAHGGK